MSIQICECVLKFKMCVFNTFIQYCLFSQTFSCDFVLYLKLAFGLCQKCNSNQVFEVIVAHFCHSQKTLFNRHSDTEILFNGTFRPHKKLLLLLTFYISTFMSPFECSEKIIFERQLFKFQMFQSRCERKILNLGQIKR